MVTCRDAVPHDGWKVKRKGRSGAAATDAVEASGSCSGGPRLPEQLSDAHSEVCFHTWWRRALADRLAAGSPDAPTASERLEALRRRVAAKEADARLR